MERKIQWHGVCLWFQSGKNITYGGEQTNENELVRETAAEYDANSSLTQIGGEANELTAVDKALEAIQK